MILQELNKLFPFKRLLKLLVGFSIILQTIIILYNHFSGYYHIPDFLNFFQRLLYSTIFTVLAGILISYPNLLIINFLNNRYSWENKPLKRIFIQIVLTVFTAVIISVFITLLAHWVDNYNEIINNVLISNALIFSVVNIILMIILEALIFFKERNDVKEVAKKLENELIQIKFEVLKNQINPHFLFNSLNVLSGLIESDLNNAQKFIDEFSLIYRYVLETIEKSVVSLNEELDFIRSYIFLQQMRYGDYLKINIDITANLLELYLPPLSLQTVLENAIKHNVINEENTLNIDIYNKENMIYIRNNIKAKLSKSFSSGVGQENLKKRYALISKDIPEFKIETDHYIVKLPLLSIE